MSPVASARQRYPYPWSPEGADIDKHEPWIERIIREAAAAGEFDDLAGSGKPIDDLDRPYDPDWWARRWFLRQRSKDEAFDLAAEATRALPVILARSDAGDARARIESINDRLRELNERLPESDRVALVDIDRLLGDRRSSS